VRVDSFQTVTVLSDPMVEENARLAIFGLALRLPPVSWKSPAIAPSNACFAPKRVAAGHRL
jgi:hypothetical protein